MSPGNLVIFLAKLTILASLLTLAGATFYFSHQYPVSKAVQLAVLIAVGVLFAMGLIVFLLSKILIPIMKRRERLRQELEKEKEEHTYVPPPKEERVKHHETKEEFQENNFIERSRVDEAKYILQQLKEEIGDSDEIMILLPYDLSFLLAKEAVENLRFSKIIDEDEESGRISATAGLGSFHQIIELTLHSATKHSTTITIISRSMSEKQSHKKNRSYIEKISDFLKKKEKFYTN